MHDIIDLLRRTLEATIEAVAPTRTEFERTVGRHRLAPVFSTPEAP